MLKFSSLLFSVLITFFGVAAQTAESKCTAWQKQEGISCIFASTGANFYQRQCENPCLTSHNGPGNLGPNCDHEDLCFFQSPTTFTGPCSDWVQDGNATCYNPQTQSYQQQWARACTIGLKETWCSANKPN